MSTNGLIVIALVVVILLSTVLFIYPRITWSPQNIQQNTLTSNIGTKTLQNNASQLLGVFTRLPYPLIMEWSSKGFFIDFHVLNMNSIDKKELLSQYSSIPFYTSSLTSLNIVDHTDYLLVGGISKGGYSVRFLALLGDQGLFNIVKTAIPSIYEAIEKKPRIHGSLKIWIVTTLGNSTTYLLTNNDGSFVAYVVMVIDWSEEELANYVEVMYRSLKHGVTSIELDDEIFYLVEKIPGSIRERGAFIAIDERNDLWIMGYHSRVEVFYTQGRGVEKIFVDYYVIKPGNETKLTDIESKALFGFNKPESIEMIGASDNYVLLRVKGGAKIFE